MYELAMVLDLLSRNCFPSWPQIFRVSERVMGRLAEVNPQLESHLTRTAAVSPKVNEKVRTLTSAVNTHIYQYPYRYSYNRNFGHNKS